MINAIAIPAQSTEDQRVSGYVPTPPVLASEQRTKSQVELALERTIDEAYGGCFRDFEIKGERFSLRIPFGENGERAEEAVFAQQILFGGKAEPQEIWEKIDSLLASGDFQDYADALAEPGEKAILFYIETGSWVASSDPEELNRLIGGPYPGTRTEICVIRHVPGIRVEDIYNYLYCIGSVGMDCSGFVYYIQKCLARSLGADLDRIAGRVLRTPVGMVPQIMGLWYFDPANGHAETVEDFVFNLRPGDIFLFRGRKGEFRHSAVIQSIDLGNGIIRYVQCTDWAPQPERGVHESFIFFDPSNPEVSLHDPSVMWTQRVFPTFLGEPGLQYWKDDGDRYRTEWPTGQSLVVRLKPIERLIEEIMPTFYGHDAECDEELLD
ncbi:MAG: peptidoglycan endopeptidase [Spirochaetia bacterium]